MTPAERQREAQAAYWCIELSETTPLAPDKVKELRAWLAEDPRNGKLLDTIMRHWEDAAVILRRFRIPKGHTRQ